MICNERTSWSLVWRPHQPHLCSPRIYYGCALQAFVRTKVPPEMRKYAALYFLNRCDCLSLLLINIRRLRMYCANMVKATAEVSCHWC
jgi:hypothetical protein